MMNKELRRLSRRELLELLVQQERQNELLKARISELEDLLTERTIKIEKSGTLAEAALALNEVFESADRAAAQYLENIKLYTERRERLSGKKNPKVNDAKKMTLTSKAEQGQQDIKIEMIEIGTKEPMRSRTEMPEFLSLRSSRNVKKTDEQE